MFLFFVVFVINFKIMNYHEIRFGFSWGRRRRRLNFRLEKKRN